MFICSFFCLQVLKFATVFSFYLISVEFVNTQRKGNAKGAAAVILNIMGWGCLQLLPGWVVDTMFNATIARNRKRSDEIFHTEHGLH